MMIWNSKYRIHKLFVLISVFKSLNNHKIFLMFGGCFLVTKTLKITQNDYILFWIFSQIIIANITHNNNRVCAFFLTPITHRFDDCIIIPLSPTEKKLPRFNFLKNFDDNFISGFSNSINRRHDTRERQKIIMHNENFRSFL